MTLAIMPVERITICDCRHVGLWGEVVACDPQTGYTRCQRCVKRYLKRKMKGTVKPCG